jgi:hypothetical protein
MRTQGKSAYLGAAALTCLLAAGATAFWLLRPSTPPATDPSPGDAVAEVHTFCAACHAFPPPETFPRDAWEREVRQGYDFFHRSDLPLKAPPFEPTVRYFEDRAPAELPAAVVKTAPGAAPVSFERRSFAGPTHAKPPTISNVGLFHLFDKDRLDVVACDLRQGRVMALSPYADKPSWKLLGEVPHPCHVEVLDLDGDGKKDILVANLGAIVGSDDLVGSVVWLRGKGDGTFTPLTLLQGVGRVADVQAADFDGDGKLDLVVAAFGWKQTGEVYYLHNQTRDWSHPHFEPHMLDDRHGAIHVPIADLDGDGQPDFVALISQEHETVVAFLNRGGGDFEKKTLYTAPHPAYGSSGIQLVDLDGDGDLDVLYTNGDVLDAPYLLKPYHSVQWLENTGDLRFVHHALTPLYGVNRAIAADVDGDGLLDVLAVSFLPKEFFPERDKRDVDAVILLRQTSPGRFERYSLEKSSCDHATCTAGDIFNTGRMDFVTGNFLPTRPGDAITVWKNRLSAKKSGKTK